MCAVEIFVDMTLIIHVMCDIILEKDRITNCFCSQHSIDYFNL
jgi:hypothetical protein